MSHVSVLVAAYEAAATLGATLESVAAQDFRDWECVVVDDGSTDHTAEVVEAWAARDRRFRLIRRSHEGVVATRNAGIKACNGDWIAILDADDLMDPRRLQLQLDAFAANPSLQVLGTHVAYRPREAMGAGRRAYEAWLNGHREGADLWRDRFVEMPLGHPTLMVRAALMRTLPYRGMGWPEDWDLLLRIMERVGPNGVGVVPEVLHHWTLREDSLSRRSPAYTTEAFTRCRAAFVAGDFLGERETYALLGYGETGKALRKALSTHGKSCRYLGELHPGRIGQVIDGAEVLHRDALPDHVQASGLPWLVSVSGLEARTALRTFLHDCDKVEGRDFLCCA